LEIKSFFDNPEEIFIGMALQFPLYFIVGWWVIPIMFLCGILWRLGGCENSSKLFRRIGVPLIVCGSAFVFDRHWMIFSAVPFMVWVAPSYGVDSWLYKLIKNDFLTRLICFDWYWFFFVVAYAIPL
jgi:hypothetical protein